MSPRLSTLLLLLVSLREVWPISKIRDDVADVWITGAGGRGCLGLPILGPTVISAPSPTTSIGPFSSSLSAFNDAALLFRRLHVLMAKYRAMAAKIAIATEIAVTPTRIPVKILGESLFDLWERLCL